MPMRSCVMQEEEVSTGKPICGWHGLAEGKGRDGVRGNEGIKDDWCS